MELVELYIPLAFYYTIVALPCTIALVSCSGSCTIMYLILKHKRYRRSIFQRLMLGLSMCDFITSASIAVAPFAVPRSTGLPLALGNFATCRASAWCVLQGYGSFYYSAALSLYFLLMIRYGKSERYTSRRLEPWVHLIPWMFPLATNIAASFKQKAGVDPLLFICTPSCKTDEEDECADEDAPLAYRFHVTDPVALMAFPLGILSIFWTWRVYRFVHKQEEASQRHSTVAFKQSKAVAIQAACYASANLNSLVVIVMVATAHKVSGDVSTLRERPYFGLFVLLLGVLFPMQGFLNWIIYCRPPFAQWRRASPDKSRWWAICKVLSGEVPAHQSFLARSQKKAGNGSASSTRSERFPRSTMSTKFETSHSLSSIVDEGESDEEAAPFDGRQSHQLASIDECLESTPPQTTGDHRPTLGSTPTVVEDDPSALAELSDFERSLQIVLGGNMTDEYQEAVESTNRTRKSTSLRMSRLSSFRNSLFAGGGSSSKNVRSSLPAMKSSDMWAGRPTEENDPKRQSDDTRPRKKTFVQS